MGTVTTTVATAVITAATSTAHRQVVLPQQVRWPPHRQVEGTIWNELVVCTPTSVVGSVSSTVCDSLGRYSWEMPRLDAPLAPSPRRSLDIERDVESCRAQACFARLHFSDTNHFPAPTIFTGPNNFPAAPATNNFPSADDFPVLTIFHGRRFSDTNNFSAPAAENFLPPTIPRRMH